MGSDSELKEENKRLKEEIENETKEKEDLQKKIDDLNSTMVATRIDLTPQQIQKLMEDNAKLTDNYNKLNDKYKKLNEKYLKLKSYCNNLILENNQVQSYCGQLQLMLLMKMQENSYNQNLNNFNMFQKQSKFFQNQINGMINNYNSNNINNNMQNNNINFQNNDNQNVITIIFNFNSSKKYPIVVLPNHRLGNILLLLLNQIPNSEGINIYELKFYYCGKNVTQYFFNNDEVKILNLRGFSPIIDVTTSF